jgi:DNA polymerase elongation subunit (family B)
MSKYAPKILVIDIEWRPTKALVWQAWDQNIGADFIMEHGGLLCVGAKWYGEKKVHLFSDWEHGHEEMVKATHEMLCEADGVVTYNGDKYDLPKLSGEFLLHGLPPPPPATSLDLYKTVRKFGYFMNKLAFIGPFLGLGSKMEHEGINLWKKVDAGDKDAENRMAKYCKQDVRVTEELYTKILPYIRNHPRLTITEKEQCPACGGKHTQRRGPRYTRCFQIQRLQCTSCGHWFDGARTGLAKLAAGG